LADILQALGRDDEADAARRRGRELEEGSGNGGPVAVLDVPETRTTVGGGTIS
jgi:hypothetical protein